MEKRRELKDVALLGWGSLGRTLPMELGGTEEGIDKREIYVGLGVAWERLSTGKVLLMAQTPEAWTAFLTLSTHLSVFALPGAGPLLARDSPGKGWCA
jgi:hypothetical protein